MKGRCLALLTLCAAQIMSGADWVSGQAARAVVGQTSFSSRDGSFNPITLAVSNRRLYVADGSRRVFTYSIESVLAGTGGGRCAVCLVTPLSVAAQAVSPASARFASFGNSVAVADPQNRRVLYWRDSSLPSASNGPDVVLTGGASFTDATSVALDGEHLYVGDLAAHRIVIWDRAALRPDSSPEATLGAREAAAAVAPVALASDGTNLFVADAASHRVLIFSPGEAVFAASSVLSTASQTATPLAPGALISIGGNYLAETSENAIDDGETAMPNSLAGVELLIDGRPIPLLAVSPTEIRAQVPYDITYASSVSVAMRWSGGVRAGRVSAAVALAVRSAAPAMFAFPGKEEPRLGVLLHSPAGAPVTVEDPATGGETLVVWASGLGAVDAPDGLQPVAGKPFEGTSAPVRAQVDALVNGEPVEVLSAVLPQAALGIYEVRLVLPRNMPPSSANVTLSLGESGWSSNTVSVPLSHNAGSSGRR